jgi:O-antigen/teichoic acid export membrane protein
MRKFLNSKLVTNSVIISIGTIIAGVFGYLFQFVISRRLTVAGYGEFQSLNSLSLMTGAVSATLGYFFLKFFPVFWKTNDRASNAAFLGWSLQKTKKWIFAYAAVFLVLTPLFALTFHLTDYYGLLFIIAAALVGVYSSIYSSALIGWEYFLPSSLAAIAAAAAKFVAGYFIVMFFPGSSPVLFSFVIGAIVGLLACVFFYKRHFSGKTMNVKEGGRGDNENDSDGDGSDWKQKYYTKFNFKLELRHVFIFALLMTTLGNVDIFLVKSMTSAEMTGFYGALHTLGAILLTINSAVIAAVSPSVYAAGHEGKDAGKRTVFFAYGTIAAVSAAGTLFFAAFPAFTMRALFGAKYLPVANDLWLFGVLTFFLSILTLEANFAYARHVYRVSWALLATVAIAASGVALFHADIRSVALAITAAFACGYIFVLLLNRQAKRKRFLEPLPLAGI